MPHIDMSKPDRELRPGVDLWEVREMSSKQSRNGEQMLKLKLARDSDPSEHLYDNIMLEGKGWGIGKRKLGAFLPAGFRGDMDPLDYIGLKLWVETMIGEYQGESQLKVNIEGLKHGGYQRKEDVPAGHKLPDPFAPSDEVPFG